MKTTPFAKAGIFACLLALLFVAGWEAYWRSQNFKLSYNDDEALWSYHRQRVYEGPPTAPVIIGSSRVKFGLDLAAWEEATGSAPVQLAQAGTSPRPVLTDLAKDENFKGTLVVGISEGLFFSPSGGFSERQAHNAVKFYSNRSIAQGVSFRINQALESKLLFLDEDRFALRYLLERLHIPDRPEVFSVPPFPIKFVSSNFDRQTFITPEFESDTSLQNEQRRIWMHIFTKAPQMPMSDSTLTGIFKEVTASVAKIKERGGQVIFIRMPSDGEVWELEKKAFPREKYWDRLLNETGAPGIHFSEYPQLSKYRCPEWSHLTPADARIFTQDFVRILQQKTGWPIKKSSPVSLSSSTTY